jgi:hypothetical protein
VGARARGRESGSEWGGRLGKRCVN